MQKDLPSSVENAVFGRVMKAEWKAAKARDLAIRGKYVS
jgi:hypothetical protein